ncbi:EamA family transporter [Brenneria populi subsp. brevivirga]|uniref:DMT family transporter n=1 Tax=Brenneria populi TaxID=1505588 RepID=UPI002E175911|nr:EamA family transporter [Brenneria populi subsp. brevivirga]
MNTVKSMGMAQWGQLVALSLLWGGSFFFTGVAVKQLPPFTLVNLRVLLAALILLLILRISRQSLPGDWRQWMALCGMGLLNNAVPFSLIVWGQTHIASGMAAILNATTPFFTLLAAHWMTADEKLNRRKLAGVLIGFAGVVVMMGGVNHVPASLAGQLAILLAALCYAFAGLYGRRFARMGMRPLATATGQVCASAVMLAPLTLYVDRPWRLPCPDIPVWGATLGLAMLSTALAYVIFFRLLARVGALNLMLVTFLIPVSAILLGALFLQERITSSMLAGMAAIFIGLIAVDGRLLARLRK